MASIKQRPGSKYYVACYTLPDGTRRQRSTGLTDPYEAKQVALRLEALGKKYARQKAVELVEDIASAVGETVFDSTSLTKWLSYYFDSRKSGWAPTTVTSYAAIRDSISRFAGEKPIGHITAFEICEYRDGLASMGRSPRTIRQHIKFLRAALAAAVEAGRLDTNPAEEIRTPTPKKSPKQPFTIPQFRALLNHTSGEWHTLILVAGLTGQRLQDVLNLRHEDFENGTIRFARHKNDDYHFVPQHPSILLPEGFGPLFPELSALPLTGSRSVSAQFRETILPKIGIVQEYAKDNGGNKQVTEYSFHSFRHMLSTELNRTGASAETRMMVVGHEDKKVSAGYTHADFETAKTALARVVI